MGSHSVTCHTPEVTFPPLPQPKLVYRYNGHPSRTNRARRWLTSLMLPTTLTTTPSRHTYSVTINQQVSTEKRMRKWATYIPSGWAWERSGELGCRIAWVDGRPRPGCLRPGTWCSSSAETSWKLPWKRCSSLPLCWTPPGSSVHTHALDWWTVDSVVDT